MYDLPDVFPDWKIEKKIGNGALGIVFRATKVENGSKNQGVVKLISFPRGYSEIKKMKSQGLGEAEIRENLRKRVASFVEEMNSLRSLPNIISIKECKAVESEKDILWDIYILMDALTPLNKALYSKAFTEEEVAKLGVDICTALEVGEANGLIHRAVKPENIFIDENGSFSLGDFALVQKYDSICDDVIDTGVLNYSAPEIANQKAYNNKADIYSLGVVMYRLLNGNNLPFLTEDSSGDANARKEALERRFKGEPLPAPSAASEEMAKIILSACAFDPNNRYENATAMKKALMELYKNVFIGITVADGTSVKITKQMAAGVAGGVAQGTGKNRHLKPSPNGGAKVAEKGDVTKTTPQSEGAKGGAKVGGAAALGVNISLDDDKTSSSPNEPKTPQGAKAKDSENKNLIPIIAVGALVLICVVIFIIFLVVTGGNDENSTEDSSEETVISLTSENPSGGGQNNASDMSEESASLDNDSSMNESNSFEEESEESLELSEELSSEDNPPIDTSNDNTGDDTSDDNPGDDTSNDNPGDDISNDNPGDDTSNDNTGDDTSNDNTGDDTSNDNPGDDISNDNPGDDTSNDNTGDDTSNDNTGDDTSNDNTGDDTSNDNI